MNSFRTFLEARREPIANPKTSAWNVLKGYYDKDSGNEFFVTFISIPIIKTNPKTQWATPAGVYCYQLADSWEFYKLGTYDKKLDEAFPFASDMPYMAVFDLKADREGVVYTSTYNDEDFEVDCNSLFRVCNKTYGLKLAAFEAIVAKAIRSAYKKHPFSWLWNLTRLISKAVLQYKVIKAGSDYKEFDIMQDKTLDNYEHNIPQRSAFVWNYLLRKLGYKVIIDDKGQSFIDTHEKMQTLILDVKAIDHKWIYDNKFFNMSDKIFKALAPYYEMDRRDKEKIIRNPGKYEWMTKLKHDDVEKKWINISFDGDEVMIDGEPIDYGQV
jgi:hypothetical protein